MTTRPDTPTLAEAQDALAAMEVACSYCHGYGPMSSEELVGIPGAAPMYGCLICAKRPGDETSATGSLPRFPALRVACAWAKNFRHDACAENPFRDKSQVCDGSGWVPNRGWAALRQAAREEGWAIIVGSNPRDLGDTAMVGDQDKLLGKVHEYEGLRDQHAETVAVWRAAVAEAGSGAGRGVADGN